MADLAPHLTDTSGPTRTSRTSRTSRTRRVRRVLPVVLVALLGAGCAAGILLWDTPAPVGSTGHLTILRLRLDQVVTIVLVGTAQGVATLVFQTVAGNRILTPSVLGFDALYRVVQTALVFTLGVSVFAVVDGPITVLAQSLLMVAFATLLYGWLFTGRRASLHVLLLVGIVLGMGFASLATFMQRLLTPSEFDVLSARLFGSISVADPEILPWAGGVVVVVVALLWRRRHVLDVLGLGRELATGLGLRYQREVIGVLVLVAVLVAVSVSLVGPMTFLGFVVAMLTYQLVAEHSHARLLPVVALMGATCLLAAFFVLKHVFYAGGLVTVVIELVGGTVFLIHLLRKGLR